MPLDPAAAGLALLVIDTRVHHGNADGEYGDRRRRLRAGRRRCSASLRCATSTSTAWTTRWPAAATTSCAAASGTS